MVVMMMRGMRPESYELHNKDPSPVHQRCYGTGRLQADDLETSEPKRETFIFFWVQVREKARKCLGRYGCLLDWS